MRLLESNLKSKLISEHMFDEGVVFRKEIGDSVFATINQIEIILSGMSDDSIGSRVVILLDHPALKMIKWTCKIVFY